MSGRVVRVLLSTPLEPHLVERIRAVDPRLEVIYRPDLIGQPRYPGDHTPPVARSETQAAEWARLLAEAEVLFDVDRPSSSDLPRRAPHVRWVQATSSGVGDWVRRLGIVASPIVVTNAAGVHARPLAEFALFAMLYFAKRMPRVLADQRAHRWERFAVETLPGKTVGVVGLGGVGREVARLAKAVGLRVIGTKRTVAGVDPETYGLDALYPRERLHELLAASDYLVLIVPLTGETTGLIGEAEFRAMQPGAVLINIARGAVVDEAALIEALRSGHLGGAALDVFSREPLPPDSPLWDLPNVLLTPHSMSTALEENELLVELFCDNLRRYLDGRPLRNVVDKIRGY